MTTIRANKSSPPTAKTKTNNSPMKPPPLPRLFLSLAYHFARALFAFLLIAALVILPPFLFAIR